MISQIRYALLASNVILSGLFVAFRRLDNGMITTKASIETAFGLNYYYDVSYDVFYILRKDFNNAERELNIPSVDQINDNLANGNPPGFNTLFNIAVTESAKNTGRVMLGEDRGFNKIVLMEHIQQGRLHQYLTTQLQADPANENYGPVQLENETPDDFQSRVHTAYRIAYTIATQPDAVNQFIITSPIYTKHLPTLQANLSHNRNLAPITTIPAILGGLASVCLPVSSEVAITTAAIGIFSTFFINHHSSKDTTILMNEAVRQ